MHLRPIQTSFSAGELSPKMLGQVDFAQYQYGCETLENFIVWPQGMASRRPGTRFIAAGHVPATAIRLIPFEFSTEQAYIIEMGHNYFRFYMDQGQIISDEETMTIDVSPGTDWAAGDVITGQTSSKTCTVISKTDATHYVVAHRSGDYTLGEIIGVTGTPAKLADQGAAHPTFVLNDTIYALAHTYTAAELFEINYCQSADILFLAHKDHPPATLTRTGHDNWTLADIVFTDAPAEWAAGNYPTVVGFYENRLFWCATPNEPHTLWGSKTGDYYIHTPGVNDDDPVEIALNSDFVNVIKWFSASKVLLLGTSRGQWHVSASSSSEAMTPSNVKAVQETGLTSSAISVRADHTVLFWQAFGRHLVEISYSLEADSYVATPLTILAEHIGLSPIKEMVYLQEPLGSLWCVREDGQLAVLTYERQHKVVAWARQVTDGLFESVARIPGTERDEIWVLVQRTIGGATKRYIEVLEDIETYENDSEDLFYVDSGLTYDGVSASTVSGLSHLEGETVGVLADGSVQNDKVVASGAITLDLAAEVVQVGLPFTSTSKPVRPEVKIQGGTLQNRRQRVTTIGIRFYKSFAGKIGESLSKLEIIPFKVMGPVMDDPPELFTGDMRVQFPGSYNRDGQVYIVQDLPLPMNLLSIMPRMDVE